MSRRRSGVSAVDVLGRLAGAPLVAALLAPGARESGVPLDVTDPRKGRSTLELDLRQAEGPILHRYRTPLLGAPDDTDA